MDIGREYMFLQARITHASIQSILALAEKDPPVPSPSWSLSRLGGWGSITAITTFGLWLKGAAGVPCEVRPAVPQLCSPCSPCRACLTLGQLPLRIDL